MSTSNKTLFANILFDILPIPMCILKERIIVECNQLFADVFVGTREQLIGHTIEILFPSRLDFELIGNRVYSSLAQNNFYKDERLMRNLRGEAFWCEVRGKALDCSKPRHTSVWTWSRVYPTNAFVGSLSQRERDTLAFLLQGLTSKQIARELNLSYRTIEMYRAGLLKKAGVNSTANLIKFFSG